MFLRKVGYYRPREHVMCVTDHHDMTLAVKTLIQSINLVFPDKIIIGSYHGTVRIFNPKPIKTENGWSGFKPEDVLLETALQNPVLQLEAGKFVS